MVEVVDEDARMADGDILQYNSALGQGMTREELKGYLVEHGLLDSERGVVGSE